MEFFNPELEAGQTVDVVVLHDASVKGRSIMEILNTAGRLPRSGLWWGWQISGRPGSGSLRGRAGNGFHE